MTTMLRLLQIWLKRYPAILSPLMLKNFLLLLAETNPRKYSYTFTLMWQKLLEHLKARKLPHYLAPGSNYLERYSEQQLENCSKTVQRFYDELIKLESLAYVTPAKVNALFF
ncbi:uncharacterized protein LOC108600753 isoform X1 [Drosophila busckii]|uniref:uncharacterized protein LOC108600753 isoform X1 n=1 Tax=Drosophila busckii TaxID=30019 RepID=UPI00083F10B3|nr:uncharacterized protein LOC108600753 isoform X1 [Drosophila busckii]